MEDEVREFVVEAVRAMNYDVSDVTGDTDLGPAGLDLESLAIAELAVQVEDKFGVQFTDEDTTELPLMTLDEFTAEVVKRIAVAPAGSAE
ncbi:MAG TPA: phosphopantetheine-binding protein [Streptosporangiaceae bacterium]|jgi:acyl carrier protein|nr:phosphopantetheine-binding protein [Streptosporangiaceae bacterium]